MTTCSVLRCLETPTAVFTPGQGSGLEAPVCAAHKTELESGARWMLNGDSILMGHDLPPNHRLTGFGVGRTIGDEPGITVTLDIDTEDGQQQVSFWTTEHLATRLGSFLTNPPKP